jgi:hypothetical protein
VHACIILNVLEDGLRGNFDVDSTFFSVYHIFFARVGELRSLVKGRLLKLGRLRPVGVQNTLRKPFF